MTVTRAMRILYIGGSGEISFECIHECIRLGHDVTVFNRGNNNAGLPSECRFRVGAIEDDAAYSALAAEHFDVVCQFRLFEPAELRRDLEIFTGRCGQYVFISTASAYRKPIGQLPITEATPLGNPFWDYSRAKETMETMLSEQAALPFTIVRPSHTYRTRLPMPIRHSASRLIRGKPVIVHGDGESLWTVTHASDVARPFARLLGNSRALGEAFHITHHQAWPWNEVVAAAAAALGVEADIVHVPSDTLARYNPAWRGPLLGDKAVSVLYDNAKVRSVAGDFPCRLDVWAGMRVVAERHPPRPDDLDSATDQLMDRIVAEQRALGGDVGEVS